MARTRRPEAALLVPAAAFALAAGLNTATLYAEQRHGALSRVLGRRAWLGQVAITWSAWMLAISRVRRLERDARRLLPGWTGVLALPAAALAAGLWLAAFERIGPRRLANSQFFGDRRLPPVHDGIYRWLDNPMYDSYALAFVAHALRTGNGLYLWLALESFLLLNVVEARVEALPFGGRASLGRRRRA